MKLIYILLFVLPFLLNAQSLKTLKTDILSPNSNIGNINLTGTMSLNSSIAINDILDEDDFTSDSASAVATQQSIKAYVDAAVVAGGSITGTGTPSQVTYWSATNTLTSDANLAYNGLDLTVGGTVTADNFIGDLLGDVTGSVTGNLIGNLTGDLTGDVYLDKLDGATYDTLQEWVNGFQSAGIITGGVITDAGSGAVDVSLVQGIVKMTNTATGSNVFFDLAATSSVTLADNDTNFIAVDYNGGTPQYVIQNSNPANGRTIFNIGKVYREGTTVDIITSGLRLQDQLKRIQQYHVEEAGLQFLSGAKVSTAGTASLDITAGVMYAGINRIPTDAVDTSGTDTFEYYYYNGAAWVETDANTIDNANYNNILSGLESLTNNRYGVHWVYKGTNGTTYVVYGQGNYRLSNAQAAQPPASLPAHVSGFGVLRAKVIILEGAASILEIDNVADTQFTASTASNHNELGGLQGGTAAEYYHLTQARHDALQDLTVEGTPTQVAYYTASQTLTSDADLTFDGTNLTVGGTLTATYLTGDGSGITGLSSGFSDPMTTRGDIIIRDSGNTTARLAIGTNAQVLTSDGTDISWEDPTGGGGGATSVLDLTEVASGTVALPVAGNQKIFFDNADNLLYSMNATGTLTQLTPEASLYYHSDIAAVLYQPTTTGCAPTVTSASLANFGDSASCVGMVKVIENIGTWSTADNNRATEITGSNMPAGTYVIRADGEIRFANTGVDWAMALTDGINNRGRIAGQQANAMHMPFTIVGAYTYTVEGTHTFNIQATASTDEIQLDNDNYSEQTYYTVWYYPPTSKGTTIPSLSTTEVSFTETASSSVSAADAGDQKLFFDSTDHQLYTVDATGTPVSLANGTYSSCSFLTGNGSGSTNSNIRKFTTIIHNIGTDFTCDNNSVNGMEVTIHNSGIYSFNYVDERAGGACYLGLTLNSTELTTAINSMSTSADRMVMVYSAGAGYQIQASISRYFEAGDIIRPHHDGNCSATTSTVSFHAARVR